MLVGGYTAPKGRSTGISVLSGQAVTDHVPCRSPSWLAWHPSLPVVYAVDEDPDGAVTAWALTGAPQLLGTGRTGGADPCHLAIDQSGRYLVTANYHGGSVSVHALDDRGGIDARTDLVRHTRHGRGFRQQSAHPHMVAVHDDEVLVVDLGGDAVYRYTLADGRLRPRAVVETPAGSGPRHLRIAGNRRYLTAELSAEVLMYDADWRLLGAVPASVHSRANLTSELVVHHDQLYVGNRGPNTIAIFGLGLGLPRLVNEFPVGDWPRHFAVVHDQVWVANERSDEVTVHTLNGDLAARIGTASPACVLPPNVSRASRSTR